MIRHASKAGGSPSRKGFLGRMLALAGWTARRALPPVRYPDPAEGTGLPDESADRRVTEAVGRLAGGVAHDLNNILLVLQGYTDLALSDPEAGPSVSAMLQEVKAANARAARLTRDLATLGWHGPLAPRSVELNELISATIAGLLPDAGERARVEWEPGPGLLRLSVDETLLERVCALLLDWAGESAAGCAGIRTESAGARETALVRILFTVKGATPGAELLARMFEPYVSGADGGKGPGLRLAAVRAIIRCLGGTVDADVPPGGGTRISIALPTGSPGPSSAPDAAQSAPSSPAILLAEQDERIRALAVKVLQGEGYTVLAARDGQEALDLFEGNRGRIGLLLLDAEMPRMGGRAVLARIRALSPGIPAIMSSGYSWSLDGPPASADFSVLPRPWKPRELLQRVRQAMETPR